MQLNSITDPAELYRAIDTYNKTAGPEGRSIQQDYANPDTIDDYIPSKN
jgi:hypothetical protein